MGGPESILGLTQRRSHLAVSAKKAYNTCQSDLRRPEYAFRSHQTLCSDEHELPDATQALGGEFQPCAFRCVMMLHFSYREVPFSTTQDNQQCSQTGQCLIRSQVRKLRNDVWITDLTSRTKRETIT
jgi:hypothetical protein